MLLFVIILHISSVINTVISHITTVSIRTTARKLHSIMVIYTFFVLSFSYPTSTLSPQSNCNVALVNRINSLARSQFGGSSVRNNKFLRYHFPPSVPCPLIPPLLLFLSDQSSRAEF